MEVPRLGVKSELHLPAYATATATRDPSCICDLHHSSQQHRIHNPLNRARDWTCILMDTSRIHNPLSRNRNSQGYLKKIFFKRVLTSFPFSYPIRKLTQSCYVPSSRVHLLPANIRAAASILSTMSKLQKGVLSLGLIIPRPGGMVWQGEQGLDFSPQQCWISYLRLLCSPSIA